MLSKKRPNRLNTETSPYLLQHASNPVHWNPWDDDAISRAKKENKPIFLSIGYSSCHWCHVMERESFTDPEIAEILNNNFISIKVDREERPDIDEIYMSAVVALTGRGGWPLTVFLTPDLKPFFGGTYFPPKDKAGMTGFKRLISRISEIWDKEKEREQIILDSDRLTKALQKRTAFPISHSDDKELSQDLLERARNQLKQSFDPEWGGFGNAPKFPASQALLFLMYDHHQNKQDSSLQMVTLTLDRMASGGIHDHLAGGFHRYSTDRIWLVPHFEKMLYDNAQLASVFSHAFLITGNKFYSVVAQNIFTYTLTYMSQDKGGFFSSEDADVNGKEGLFYLWEQEEIENLLNKQEADLVSSYFHVEKNGNFSFQEPYHQGLNILHTREPLSRFAEIFQWDKDKVKDVLTSAKKKLLHARDKRERPFLDDKVITSWNALMVSALSLGYQVFQNPDYLSFAQKTARFIISHMRNKDHHLLRTHRAGKSKQHAYLQDHALLINALIDLYEADFNPDWLNHAETLTEEMVSLFWDHKKDCFYNTSHHHHHQLVRTVTATDSALPSSSGSAVEALMRIGRVFQKKQYLEKSLRIVQSLKNQMEKYPHAYMKMLINASFLIYPEKEIALVGDRDSTESQKLLKTVWSRFLPNRTLVFSDPKNTEHQMLSSRIPLLQNKKLINGKSAAYVCTDLTCQKPVTNPEQLNDQI
ncbi:MAG: DUF255 domain-containing protein [Candidatus Aminicenantes bacterium]|nr:DUF255 domain-containing protein [Candidatus Aminicenantes bacterium]